MQAPITFRELTQLSPTIKQQLRDDLSKEKLEQEIVHINVVGTEELEFELDEEQEEEEEEHTSVYLIVQIEDKVVTAVEDTDSGVSIISKLMLDHLGWHIEVPNKLHMIIADNYKFT